MIKELLDNWKKLGIEVLEYTLWWDEREDKLLMFHKSILPGKVRTLNVN